MDGAGSWPQWQFEQLPLVQPAQPPDEEDPPDELLVEKNVENRRDAFPPHSGQEIPSNCPFRQSLSNLALHLSHRNS